MHKEGNNFNWHTIKYGESVAVSITGRIVDGFASDGKESGVFFLVFFVENSVLWRFLLVMWFCRWFEVLSSFRLLYLWSTSVFIAETKRDDKG